MVTRRGLFATIAALLAGRKAVPVPLSRWSNAVGPPLSPEPLRQAIRQYSHVQYGVGIKLSREMLEDDALYVRLHKSALRQMRRREEQMAAQILFGGK